MSEVKTPHSYMYVDVMGGGWSFHETFASKCNGWHIEGHWSRNLKLIRLRIWQCEGHVSQRWISSSFGSPQTLSCLIFIPASHVSEWWGLYIMNISPDSKNTHNLNWKDEWEKKEWQSHQSVWQWTWSWGRGFSCRWSQSCPVKGTQHCSWLSLYDEIQFRELMVGHFCALENAIALWEEKVHAMEQRWRNDNDGRLRRTMSCVSMSNNMDHGIGTLYQSAWVQHWTVMPSHV